MTDLPDIDITFRGVAPREDLIAHVRRAYRAAAPASARPLDLHVLVERAPRAAEARAYAMVVQGSDVVRARARHADERVAAELAVARLTARLAPPATQVLRRGSVGRATFATVEAA